MHTLLQQLADYAAGPDLEANLTPLKIPALSVNKGLTRLSSTHQPLTLLRSALGKDWDEPLYLEELDPDTLYPVPGFEGTLLVNVFGTFYTYNYVELDKLIHDPDYSSVDYDNPLQQEWFNVPVPTDLQKAHELLHVPLKPVRNSMPIGILLNLEDHYGHPENSYNGLTTKDLSNNGNVYVLTDSLGNETTLLAHELTYAAVLNALQWYAESDPKLSKLLDDSAALTDILVSFPDEQVGGATAFYDMIAYGNQN